MSARELETLLAMLRQQGAALLDAEPAEARAAFEEMMSQAPAAPDVKGEPVTVGGVPALRLTTSESEPSRTLIYLHGGAYVIGSSRAYQGLASDLARAAGVTGLSLDYRLAPEHPFPAAVDDAVAAYKALLDEGRAPASIGVAGDSAGGGLAVAFLVAARRAGLPMPGAALLISPWVDLACTAETYVSKLAEDPALRREGLLAMAGRYLGKTPASEPLASPVHADLAGLPPMLIQVGSAEVLLDDSVRLAGRAGAAGVFTRLEIWPNMPHVWHGFAGMLGEGRRAVKVGGNFLGRRMKA